MCLFYRYMFCNVVMTGSGCIPSNFACMYVYIVHVRMKHVYVCFTPFFSHASHLTRGLWAVLAVLRL